MINIQVVRIVEDEQETKILVDLQFESNSGVSIQKKYQAINQKSFNKKP